MVDALGTREAMAADANVHRPLLADHARGPVVVVIFLAIIVVAVLGMRYANQDAAGSLDRTLDTFIRTHIRQGQPLVRALVMLGNPLPATIVVAAVAAAAAVARRWSGVVLTIGGTLAAVTITELILKPLVMRLRYGHLSFPSGHSTTVAAVAIATSILLTGAQRPRSLAVRLVAGVVPIVVAAGVAVGLIAEHIHYATDTLAGCCVAAATVLTVALLLDVIAPRVHRSSQPTG
jgi:membrane-associated phospholipid phosphatase